MKKFFQSAIFFFFISILLTSYSYATQKKPSKSGKAKEAIETCALCEEAYKLVKSLDEKISFDAQEEVVEQANDFLEMIPKKIGDTSFPEGLSHPLVIMVSKLEKIDGSLYGLELFIPIYQKSANQKKFDQEIEKLPRKKDFKESLANKIAESKGKNGG